MTNFKQYFKHYMKSALRTIIYFLAIVIFLTFVIGNASQSGSRYDYELKQLVPDYYSTLHIPVMAMIMLCYIVPVKEFAFFKKRINLDLAYSLPISRRAMGTVHYLVGLITVYLTFTASYLTNFLMLLSRAEYFYFTPMIGHYFFCLLFGFLIYSFFVLVFNMANTKGDGIWFIILYTFLVILVCGALSLLGFVFFDTELYFAMPWGVIDIMTSDYKNLVEMSVSGGLKFFERGRAVFWLVFWIVVGIASAVGFFLSFGKRRMEETEEISDTWFGYRLLIPIFAVCGMIVFQDLIFGIIIWLFAVIGYTIYRRGFRYKKSDLIILALLIPLIALLQ